MSNQRSSRARWSPVVVALALGLIVAMSGSATAAVMIGSKQIKRNAVGTKHLKNGAVGPKQIKNRAVNGKKIKANAIKPGHISPRAKAQLAGQEGPEGPQGPKGDKGDKGDPGDVGVSGYEIVTERHKVSANSTMYLFAECPSGKKLIGGGLDATGTSLVARYQGVSPGSETEWLIWAQNSSNNQQSANAQAICISAN